MRDKFHPDMSVEKMAAWLDGNLSAEEMMQMAQQIHGDPMLEEVVTMSDQIDSDVEAFDASGESLPEELQHDDFDIPRTTRWTDRHLGSMYGNVCDAMPACCAMPPCYAEYDCCDAVSAAPPDDEEDSDEESGLLDKLKGLFSGEKEKN